MGVTFRAEVYGYIRSRGLFAGAAFEGTRLGLDDDANAMFYAASADSALEPPSAETPPAVRRFLLSLAEAEIERSPSTSERSGTSAAQGSRQSERADEQPAEEARTFPLGGSP